MGPGKLKESDEAPEAREWEGDNDAVDEFDVIVIEERAGVRRGIQLVLGTILYLEMLVGKDLGIGGIDVAILGEDGFDVTVHHEANLELGHVKAVSPGEFNVHKLVAFPLFCYTRI